MVCQLLLSNGWPAKVWIWHCVACQQNIILKEEVTAFKILKFFLFDTATPTLNIRWTIYLPPLSCLNYYFDNVTPSMVNIIQTFKQLKIMYLYMNTLGHLLWSSYHPLYCEPNFLRLLFLLEHCWSFLPV